MNTRITLGVLGFAIVAALGDRSATAVETDQPAVLAEVVVTAQKRTTSLQDVPFSVAAESQEQIRNAGAGNIVDLARNVAGLTIADLGPGQSQIAIRGISSGQVIRDQPGVKEQVGVYLDESPISIALFTPDLELFDLDRFEVLRGPQGTLFGAGSESGTLRYITTQPKLGKFEGIADASYEMPRGGTAGGSARLAVNLPMGDTAAIRFVGYGHHLPGFVDAIHPDGSVEKGVNDGDRSGFRVAVLWKPIEQLSITPRIVYQNLRTDGFPREDVYNILANPYTTTQPKVTIGDRQQYTQLREGIDDSFTLADLKLDYDFGPAVLTSISSFTHRTLQVTRDASTLSGSVTFDVFGDIPEVRLNSPLQDRTALNAFSQEVRLSSNGSSRLDWLVGGFFQHIGRRYGQSLPTPGYDALNANNGFPLGPNPVGLIDTPFFSDIDYRFKQYAAFGEATYHLTDQWALTGGLRYYKFQEDRLLIFNGVFAAATRAPGSVDSDGISPRGIVTYKLNEDAQFNAQVSKGFRLGGINDPINLPLCSPQDAVEFGGQGNWKDEKSKNYEVGGKFRLMDNRVTFNVSAFYTDIKDLQATVTAGTCSSRIIFNANGQSHGVEAEVFARPNSNWDFGLSASWVDATLTSSVVSTSTVGAVTTTSIVGGLADGNRLPTAPQFQAVGSIGYTLPLADSHDLFSIVTVQYVGSSYSQFENEQPGFGNIGGTQPFAARLIPYGGVPGDTLITFDPKLAGYSLGNFRLGVRTDRWEFAGYVNNMWDTNAHLAIDYERGRSARVSFFTNQPRTFGIYTQVKF